MTYNAFYTVESGASKERKRKEEIEYWNSLNGPVVTTKNDKAEKDVD
jgi:hypothetical protein